MRRDQRGFINVPAGFFETLFALAFVGVLAVVAGGLYGIWWLIQHVRFV